MSGIIMQEKKYDGFGISFLTGNNRVLIVDIE
jgi:hypothetical protein